MNNMNPIYQEWMAHRQAETIQAEIKQSLLEKEMVLANPIQTGWVAHRVAHFAEWMIVTGENIRQRYDHTAMHDCTSRTNALAR